MDVTSPIPLDGDTRVSGKRPRDEDDQDLGSQKKQTTPCDCCSIESFDISGYEQFKFEIPTLSGYYYAPHFVCSKESEKFPHCVFSEEALKYCLFHNNMNTILSKVGLRRMGIGPKAKLESHPVVFHQPSSSCRMILPKSQSDFLDHDITIVYVERGPENGTSCGRHAYNIHVMRPEMQTLIPKHFMKDVFFGVISPFGNMNVFYVQIRVEENMIYDRDPSDENDFSDDTMVNVYFAIREHLKTIYGSHIFAIKECNLPENTIPAFVLQVKLGTFISVI